MSNSKGNVLYIGVTHDIFNRVQSHRNKNIAGFTKKYNCTKLIYFEQFNNREEAYLREKQLKGWKRAYKDELVAKLNPEKEDLFERLSELLI